MADLGAVELQGDRAAVGDVRATDVVRHLPVLGHPSHGRVCHYVPVSTERAQSYIRS